MKFVSLFAGAGGFDLGLERAGHECVGQCEIEPVAVSVLRRHWPTVPKHDDVTTITASTFEHPDLVTFGSPCQDLSVAGKRAGMSDGSTRSGLFYEAVRYIREVQEATRGRLPKLAVWENVPGAYSSHNGWDFATVLALLVGGEVGVPTNGWPNAGVAFGPLGSAEWRTLDSQYFGVAQRRRRVFLVYRPGGERAGEVLLEPDGVRGDTPQSRAPGEGITGSLTGGFGSSSAGNPDDNRAQAGFVIPVEVAPTVTAQHVDGGERAPRMLLPAYVVQNTVIGRHDKAGPSGRGWTDGACFTLDTTDPHAVVAPTLTAREGKGPDSDAPTTLVAYAATDYRTGAFEERDTAEPLTTSADRTRAAPIVAFSCKDSGQDVGHLAPTLRAMPHDASHANGGGQVAVAFALRGRDDGAVPEVHQDGSTVGTVRGTEGGSSRDYVAFAQNQRDEVRDLRDLAGAVAAEPGMKQQTFLATPYAVRRLTPRECERLQAFPDDWTRYASDGREIADTHRYRLMGNAVTTSVITWIGRRLA
jgi:DNA (cytosine-5)-methyltransferase 1